MGNVNTEVYNMLNDIYPQGCTLAVHNSQHGKTELNEKHVQEIKDNIERLKKRQENNKDK